MGLSLPPPLANAAQSDSNTPPIAKAVLWREGNHAFRARKHRPDMLDNQQAQFLAPHFGQPDRSPSL